MQEVIATSHVKKTLKFVEKKNNLYVKVSASTIRAISEQVGKFLFEEEESLAKPNPQKLFEKEFPQERCYLQVDGAMLPWHSYDCGNQHEGAK